MADDRHQNALPNGYQFEGYRIEDVLGAGSFGVTYKARELAINRLVAIKEYMPSGIAHRNPDDSSVRPISSADAEEFEWGLDRFQKEASTLVSFHHPNIVPVYRFFAANGTAYMVMEYQQGESLAEFLIAGGKLDEREIYDIIDPLLEGLERVHATGFLHRDIKPGNIYLRDDGSPVLIDFGAARQALGEKSQNLTRIFTPGYAPHEQYETSGHQGPWTDIYALGAVMYLLVTDEPPVDAPTRLSSQARGNPDPLKPAVEAARKGFSRPLLETIDRALSIMETDRPQTIAELRGDLLGRRGEEVPSARMQRTVTPVAQQSASRPPSPGGTIGPRYTPPSDGPAQRSYGSIGRAQTEDERGAGRRSVRTLIYAALGVLMLGGVGVASYVATDGFGTGEATRQEQIAKRKAEEARRKAEIARQQEEQRKQEEARRQAEETRRQQGGETKRQQEAEAKRKAAEEARRKAAEEARRKTAEEARRKAAEEARRKAALEEAKRRQAEEAKRRALEAKRKAEEARKAAEARRRAEEARKAAEARRRAEETRRREGSSAEEARRRAAEEAKRRAAEEARRRQAEEARRRATEEARRRAAEETRARQAEEARRRAAEEARKRQAVEARRRAAEAARRRQIEAARRRKAEEARRKERQIAGLTGTRIRAAIPRVVLNFRRAWGPADRTFRLRFLAGGRLSGSYIHERTGGFVESTETGNDTGTWTLNGNRLCLRWRSWNNLNGCYTLSERNGSVVATGGGGVLPRSFRVR